VLLPYQVRLSLLKGLGVEIVADHGDYRLMSRRAVDALKRYGEVNLFLRAIIPRLGFKAAEVAYERKARFAGTSKYPFGKMLTLAVNGVTSFSMGPLRVITMTGFTMAVVSFLIDLWAICLALFTDRAVPGWASIVVPITLVGGVQMVSRRHGETWSRSLLLAAIFAAVCGLLFIALACFGFIAFTGQPLSLAGLATSVDAKAGEMEAHVSIPARIAREVFGTANNFIGTQSIGIIGRAWLTGAITSIRPYVPTLLTEAVPWLATSVLLAAIYLRTLLRLGTPRICLMLVAFLCGAQAWSFFYSLNDPEHWFQQTVPTVLLFLTLFGQATVQLVLPLWAAGTLLFNLWAIAIPPASYPLLRYQAELHRDFGPKDLLIYFAAYPGGPYLGSDTYRAGRQMSRENLLQVKG
jgi:hypothetical protein